MSNQASRAEKEAVMNWMSRSRRNQSYLIELKKIWIEATRNNERNSLESQQDLLAILRKTNIQEHNQSKKSVRTIISVFKRAAIWLLIVGFTFGSGYILSNILSTAEEGVHQLVADKGHVSQVILEDGTRVWLNSGSRMTFPAEMGKERKVRLQGEAYFEVFSDHERPFHVEIDCGTIIARGTRFTVSCYNEDEDINAVLVEGNIDWLFPGDKIISLSPNEKVTLNKPTAKISRMTVDTELYYGWIENRFIFNNDKLSEIIKELERWYKIEINIKDKELETQEFSGIFPKTVSVKSFLKILSTTGIKYKIIQGTGDKEIIELYRKQEKIKQSH